MDSFYSNQISKHEYANQQIFNKLTGEIDKINQMT
jgi:hypothetical protein